ncbi:hypothetical protein BS50DRAFT_587677 [Corynespora cassiicola Philippines]|uniref:Uncharacterized protein n=1 Tax=Corynespora cassiicola Philippines TaxID=1448308 RepID=A0A2T2NMB4_CORCC|nr:hypothetical protein BS50DRAFT_587677 [Corynespora cassiicola Philippines]
MYRTEQYMRYGIWGIMIIVLESHVGITCACLPYLRFIFDHIFKNYLSQLSNRYKTDTRTKTKQSDIENDGHPFHELAPKPPANKIYRRTSFDISILEQGSDEDLVGHTNIVGKDEDSHSRRDIIEKNSENER